MLNQTSTTAIARTLLLAGILLAVTVLAARSFFPAFAQETIEYEENGTDPVAVFTAIDPEGEDVTWELTGLHADAFSIDGGVLAFKSAPDFEDPTFTDAQGNPATATNNEYQVTVEATGGDETESEELVVEVVNIEELGTLQLSAFQPRVEVLLTATLTDDDGSFDCAGLTVRNASDKNLGDEIETKWQWATSTSATGPWNDIRVETRSSYTPRDSDVGMYLQVTVTYCDGYGDDDPFTPDTNELMTELSVFADSAVLAKDYKNAVPEFPDQDPDATGIQLPKREVPEDASPGDSVGGPVVAEDKGPDGSQESLTYTLVDENPEAGGDDEESFTIDRATGQIRVGANAKLNFEASATPDTDDKAIYTITVRAADPSDTGVDPFIFSVDVEVTINVTDVNESPMIDRDPPLTTQIGFQEHSLITNALIGFDASDEDAVDVNKLTWAVERGTSTRSDDRQRFMINAAGELSFAAQPDYDNPWNSNNTYKIKVVITDSAGNTDSEDVTVAVRNDNEAGIVEMSNRQAEVGTAITATLDDEDGAVGNITWEWAFSGTTVTLMGGSTSTYEPLPDHANTQLTVTASYYDTHVQGIGTDVRDTATVETNAFIAQVQPKPTTASPNTKPKFIDSQTCSQGTIGDATTVSAASRQVAENTVTGTHIGDPVSFCDAEDTNLTYSLSRGDVNSFDIDRGIGQLKTKASPDIEKKSKYSVTVRATDPTKAYSTVVVAINILEVNEPPVFTSGATSTKYAEGARGTHRVGTYAVSDPEGETVTLTMLEQGDAEDFTFENGVLSFKQAPDYEAPLDTGPDNEYVVTLQASDGVIANDEDQEVTIEVTNVNEEGVVTLTSEQPKEGVPITAKLIDPDGSPTVASATDLTDAAKWQWYRSRSNRGPWTEIEATEATDDEPEVTSNMKTYTPSMSDVGQYLRASASYIDGHSPNGLSEDRPDKTSPNDSGVSANTVRMKDYRNKPPMFTGADGKATTTATTTRRVLENTPAGTAVGDPVDATDLDENGQQESLTYTPGATQGGFVVDMGTGQIHVGDDTNLKYEELSDREHKYEVEVVATDPSGETGTNTVTIMVINVNEPPKIDDAEPDAGLKGNNLSTVSYKENRTSTSTDVLYSATDDEDDAANPRKALKWSLSGPDMELFAICEYVASDSACTSPVVATADAELSFKEIPDFESPSDANGDNVYNVTVTVTDSHDNTDTRDVAVTVTNEEEDGEVTVKNLVPEVGIPIEAALSDPDGGERDINWKWWALSLTDLATQPEIQCTSDSDTNSERWTHISEATSRTYTPVSGDEDKCLAATATYRDAASENDPFTIGDQSILTATGTPSYVVKGADSNNKAPVFGDQDPDTTGDQSDRATRHVPENTKRDLTDIIGVSGTYSDSVGKPVRAEDDADEPGISDILTYTLGGADASSFTIDTIDNNPTAGEDANTIGQIRVGKGTELDHETKDTYTVDVIATDPSGASDTITVTIKIVDVGEEPKVSKKGLAVSGDRSITVAEGSSGDLATYTASGADASGARWSLEGTGTDAGAFNISSGILSFRSTPNYENPADSNSDNVYNVTVKATSGNISATRSVTVVVTNVNEDGSVSISPSGQPRVGTALTASVTDEDVVVANSVSWQWASSSNGSTGWGDISVATSATYTPVDGDAGNFLRATASYRDGHGPGKNENAVTSSAVAAVVTEVPQDGSVSLSPSQLVVGDTVSASLSDPNSNETNLVWAWAKSSSANGPWTTISGASGSSYTTVEADAGNYLQATVSYDDSVSTGNTAEGVTANRVKLHRFDGNANGAIERDEVIEAINDYLFGTGTERDEVIEVINLYLFG